MNHELEQKIAVTWVLCGGRELPDMAKELMLRDLERFDEQAVSAALDRCRVEVSRITLKDIVDRIPSEWPSPDEAWALCPASEAETVVWTEEAAAAFQEVSSGLLAGNTGMEEKRDRVAMRMAFKDVYARLVDEAKARGERPEWYPSLGTDEQGREPVLREARAKGRLKTSQARALLPDVTEDTAPLLPGDTEETLSPEAISALVRVAKDAVGQEWDEDEIKRRVAEILEKS